MRNLEKSSLIEHAPDSKERSLVAAVLIVIVSLTILDISVDLAQGIERTHIIVEAVIIPLAGLGLYVVWCGLMRAHRNNELLQSSLQEVSAAAAVWREEAARHLRGLSEAIDSQLGRWGLSTAEKEIALLMLKGLSHKEIANIRKTSERTVRQQALAVYEKSGLSGRAQLSAFFLEDLLAPPDLAQHLD